MPANRAFHDRVVVTGIGVVTPFGRDTATFLQQLHHPVAAHSGRAAFAGHVDDFGPLTAPTKRLIRKSLKLMNRETQLGVAAAQHAITSSGLAAAGYEPDRVGVCFGAGNVEIRRDGFAAGVAACREALGEFDPAAWGDFGIPHVDPLWILRVLPNMPACHTAIANDLRGPNNTITQADVATVMAITEARNSILDGDADAMIVGGTGTNFLESAEAESPSDVPPAEAAGAFVLERLDAAQARKATIFAEILATASSTMIESDHRARPYEAAQAAVDAALDRAGISPNAIGLLQTDPGYVDFGDATQSLDEVQIRMLKQRTGDAAAGSSAMEIAASLLELHGDEIHSNGRLTDADHAPTVAINVNVMQNGLASCLVLGKVQKVAA